MESADIASVRVESEALAARLYPELIPDVDRSHSLLTRARNDSGWYAKVVGPVAEPRAALVAQVGDNVWATRRHATIMTWYSKQPGAGAALLKDFVGWVREQKSIVLAGWCDDFGVSKGTDEIFKRAGFVKRGGMYVLFPRGEKK
jgi:hypothetical protein